MTTVTTVLADVKTKAFLSADQTTVQDSDILGLMWKELTTVIMPKILTLREGYFGAVSIASVGQSSGTNGTRFRIPARALGGKIFDLRFSGGGVERSLSRISPYDVRRKEGFWFDGNDIVVNQWADLSQTLKIYYPCRPLPFTSATTALSTVTNVSGNTVTVSVASGTFDVCSSGNPYQIVVPDAVVSGSSFTKLDDQNVQIGDVLQLQSGTQDIPLPVELHDWLSQRVAMRVLEILGDAEGMSRLGAKLKDIEKDAWALTTPRADGEEKVIVDKETLGWRNW